MRLDEAIREAARLGVSEIQCRSDGDGTYSTVRTLISDSLFTVSAILQTDWEVLRVPREVWLCRTLGVWRECQSQSMHQHDAKALFREVLP